MTFWEWLASLFRPPKPTPKPVPPAPKPEPPSAMLDALNAARSAHQLVPFMPDVKLDLIAGSRAAKMHRTGVLSHDGVTEDFFAHYPRRKVTEVLAWGQQTATQAVHDWMNEEPDEHGRREHREAIINPAFRYVGCGRSGNYHVVDLLGQ